MIYPRIMVGEGGVFEIIYRDRTETWLNKVLDPITYVKLRKYNFAFLFLYRPNLPIYDSVLFKIVNKILSNSHIGREKSKNFFEIQQDPFFFSL